MRPLDALLVECVLFLLARYAKTGWVPDGEPPHREPRPGDPYRIDCTCTACKLARDLDMEAR